jgi:phytoene dehydrogenase-like protein
MPSLLYIPVFASALVVALMWWILRAKRPALALPWRGVLSADARPTRLTLLPAATVAAQEAAAGSAATGEPLPPGYRVAVVGGGLAGCTAARLLARHGASVTLFERGGDVGGRAATKVMAAGKWPLRVEAGLDCAPSGAVALAEARELAGVPAGAVFPVDDYLYVYSPTAALDGVVLPGRTPAAILRMGAALHVVHRLRLLVFRLRTLASATTLDPLDPLSLCAGHPLLRGDASCAASAARLLGGVVPAEFIVDSLARSMFHTHAGHLPPGYLVGLLGGGGLATRWAVDKGMGTLCRCAGNHF